MYSLLIYVTLDGNFFPSMQISDLKEKKKKDLEIIESQTMQKKKCYYFNVHFVGLQKK